MADPTPTKPSPIAIALTLTAAALAGVQVSPALDALPSWVSQFVNIAIIVLAAVGTKLHVDAHKAPDRAPAAGFARFDVAFVLAAIGGVALALLLAMHLAGCATLHTMTGAFASCARADLGQIVTTDGKDLAQDVAALIEGNAAALEAELVALAGQVGLDAVDCAVASYDAAHPPATGSDSATTNSALVSSSLVVANPGLVRAKAWIATQRKVGK